MREKLRDAIPWMVTGLLALAIVYHHQFFGLDTPVATTVQASGPTRDIALAGGGVSDGSKCGAKGYHYFVLSAVTNTGGMLPGTPAGPAAVLAAYGTEITEANDPGDFTINL